MQEQPQTSSGEFGMTEEDIKNYKLKTFLGRIKYYLLAIEPAVVKILSLIIYYSVRFTKAVVFAIFRMILGKEV